MGLRIILRSYSGENLKGRPDYYSKDVCLASLLRAAEEADAPIVFINDGPVPDAREREMHAAGEVVQLPGVGMRRSYLFGLRYAAEAGWAADDVVWFSEDDYLYRSDALRSLTRAAQAIPAADYFALYGDDPAAIDLHSREPHHVPRGWRNLPGWDVDGQRWVRGWSTASTFGARVGALREDLGIFRFCTFPHRHMYRDHDTCLLYQGFEPYSYRSLLRDAAGLSGGSPTQRLRAAALAPVRLATNLRSHRRPSRRRMLLTARPNIATHMEWRYLAPGTDWAAVAAETREWAHRRGLADFRAG